MQEGVYKNPRGTMSVEPNSGLHDSIRAQIGDVDPAVAAMQYGMTGPTAASKNPAELMYWLGVKLGLIQESE